MSASKETQHAPGSYVPSSSTYSYQGEQPPPYSGAPPMYNSPKTETTCTQQYESFSDINPEISSDTTPLISSSSFDDQTVRKGFVRKVFSIVAIQLLFTCTVVCVFTFSSVVKEEVQSHLWAYLSSFIIFLVVVIALNCCKSFSRQHPWNIVALFVITVSFSFMMGTIASYHNTAAVIITMGATLVISITIMVFSVQNRFDFNICNSILLVVIVDIALFGIFCSFYYTYIAEVIYGCLGALLFSVYLAIDCQLMMGMMSYRADPEDYVNAALRIYLDVALIFLFLLGRR
uniref:Si:ch211-284o19.8 n=1 Tax=Amphilophus citrinellus TaxID=61819 RepID=A0A3Q0RUS2_AMPCI